MKSKITRNIVIIVIILLAAFFSQQAHSRKNVQNFFPQFLTQGTEAVQGYLAKGFDWLKDNIYPKISGEVQKRGEIIKDEINQEKQKVSETIGEKIKNYFSGVIDNIFNSGKNNNAVQNSIPGQELIQGQPYP